MTKALNELTGDPVIDTICYIQDMGGYNALFLMNHSLTRPQLLEALPAIRKIVKDYSVEEPSKQTLDLHGYTKESYSEEKQRADETRFMFVYKFLLNFTDVAGLKALETKFRTNPDQVSIQELNFMYTVMRLVKYQISGKALEQNDMERISSALDSVGEVLNDG